MKLHCIILELFLVFDVFTKIQTQGIEEEFSIDRNRVVLALEKVVSFYERNGDTLNLDAYFGLRIAQGLSFYRN